jgi:type II secretory pathway pseudopilin PulG
MAIWHEEYELYRKYVHNISRFYKQHEQIKAYVELALSLVAIIIFLAFAIRPTAVTITEKVKELQSKQEVITKLNAKIDSLSTADSLLREEKETLDMLEVAIPDGSAPEEFIIQVDALARRNNTELEGMSIEDTQILGTKVTTNEEGVETAVLGTIEWFPFTIVTSGPYEDLVRFGDSLENLRRPMKINSAAMDESLTGELKLTVTGEIPYYTND